MGRRSNEGRNRIGKDQPASGVMKVGWVWLRKLYRKLPTYLCRACAFSLFACFGMPGRRCATIPGVHGAWKWGGEAEPVILQLRPFQTVEVGSIRSMRLKRLRLRTTNRKTNKRYPCVSDHCGITVWAAFLNLEGGLQKFRKSM